MSVTGGAAAIAFEGSWSNIHISGNAITDTGNAVAGEGVQLHCTLTNSVCDGAWVEDNTITHGNQDFPIEVGCFCPSPYPAPTNVHVLRNHISMAAGYSTNSAGAVSMSTAKNSEVGGNSFDTHSTSPISVAAYEIPFSPGMDIHDNAWFNPASGGTHVLFICNGCTNSVFHHNIGAGFGEVYSGGNPGTGANTAITRVEVSDNIFLPPLNTEPGIDIECNGTMNSIDSINVHDNLALGNTSSSYGVALSNDTGCSYTNVTSENNVLDGFLYGASAGSNTMTGIRYHHNTYLNLGTGVYTGNQTPETRDDNNQGWVIPKSLSAFGINLTGAAPTLAAGAAAGTSPTGPGCLSTVTCTPFRGAVNVVIGSAPPTSGIVFTNTVPANTFPGIPICTVTANANSVLFTTRIAYDNIGSTATVQKFDLIGGAAFTAADNVDVNYICLP